MNFRRIFRGPLFWIILAVLLVLVIAEIASQAGGYEKVDTSKVFEVIENGRAAQVTLVDRDQEVRVETTERRKDQGQLHRAAGQPSLPSSWTPTLHPTARSPKYRRSRCWSPSCSRFGPIILILLLLFFFMNQMQGGGSRVMNFGKSKAKVVTKDMPQDHFRGRRRRQRGRRRALRNQGLPAGPGQVPGRGRQDSQGRAALRPTRHR